MNGPRVVFWGHAEKAKFWRKRMRSLALDWKSFRPSTGFPLGNDTASEALRAAIFCRDSALFHETISRR